jgi:uncharacterized membrane protein YdjX (TVP38/TMEM64 family)
MPQWFGGSIVAIPPALQREGMTRNNKIPWVVIGAVVFAALIVPFLVFGDAIEAWTRAFLEAAGDNRPLVAAVLGGLLASDIAMPIPSSIVSTACGLLLGLAAGTLVSLAGMVVSCALGFAFARGIGRAWVARAVGPAEMARLTALGDRYGDWMLIIARPVPVLAEASVLVAGVSGIGVRRFFVLTTLSNAAISAAYAAIGALAAGVNSFLLAVAGSILLPWIFIKAFRPRPSPRHGVAPVAERTEGVSSHDDH